MVKATRNGVTTTYIGNYFEWEDNHYTKYYYTGSQRFAMRTNQSGSDVLQYILSDHLGSTSTIVDASGDYVARTGYMPWGSERYTTADIPTDYRYTGQRLEDDLGIYYYNARWYDPSIGRFLQADTIVPDPGNPLAYDRYAYVLNNPLRYTDPSGHLTAEQIEEWTHGKTKDDFDSHTWKMLRALRFGDKLSYYEFIQGEYSETKIGTATLNKYGDLVFGDTLATELPSLNSGASWLLYRTLGLGEGESFCYYRNLWSSFRA